MYLHDIVACSFLLIFRITQATLQSDIKLHEDNELPVKRDFPEINKGLTGLIDGDILPSKTATRNTITDQTLFWPSHSIPVAYASDLSLKARGSIELARQEFRLKTCLDFVDQTIETDYINFQSLVGCYSYIGRIGGNQTLSLGSGCETIGIVGHEMLHAIGVWHEQSRADRDDYVQIMLDEVTTGYEHNFNKYDIATSNTRRVPYDYGSVMHYGQSAFSENDNPTIVSRNPYFQNLVGQRSGLSKGDVAKVKRMYQCGDTLLYTYNCDFEGESDCGYINDYQDDTDWISYSMGDGTVTLPPSSPSTDVTVAEESKGSYLVLDTSAATPDNLGSIKSMRFLTRSPQQCLQFWYFIAKDASSDAAVTVEIGTLNDQHGNITSTTSVDTLTVDTVGYWNLKRMTINAPSEYRLIFTGVTASYQDTFAIDDISVMDMPCDDAYFVTHNYSQVLNDYPKGSSLRSEVMTTNQGYNFRILIYPQGTDSAEPGYMSLFFGLVQGSNDDTMDWPFCNKYVRLMVTDQCSDPLYAFSKSSQFLTSQSSGGDIWNKPTSGSSTRYWGFTNFLKISDYKDTHNYLKGDRLVVSVLVQDMNWVNNEVCSGTFSDNSDSPSMKLGNSNDIDVDISAESGYEYGPKDENNDHDHHDGGYLTVAAAIGMALGVALIIFLAMVMTMFHVTEAHRKEVRFLQSAVASHFQSISPPSYSPETTDFMEKPLPEV